MHATLTVADKKYQQTERALLICGWTFLGLAGAVVLCAIVIEIAASAHGRVLLAVITTIAASLLSGALLGLLFGIPAVGSNGTVVAPNEGGETVQIGDTVVPSAVASNGASTARLTANDSLVRVSQWLTTIIVGLTIAEFKDVVAAIEQIGLAVASAVFCGASCAAGSTEGIGRGLVATGAAAVIAFTVLGFLLSYLWTRVYLPRELLQSEADALKVSGSEREAQKANLVQEPPITPPSGAAAAAAPARQTLRTARILSDEPGLEIKGVQGQNPDDPWKGVFGGQAAVNGYVLSATVAPSKQNSEFFVVDIHVDRPADKATVKGVKFYLHPTFPEPRRKRTFKDGRASIALLAWGAFTVGVLTDDDTRLELDLSELPNAPDEFKSR